MQLQSNNLSIGYGNDKIIFSNISFAAAEGDLIALLGVNGIGKSTLLRTISGLQKSVSGRILIEGKDLQSLSVQERAKLISIVLTERIFVDNISVKEFITLGRAPYTNWLGKLSQEDADEIERVIAIMKIEKLQHNLFNRLSDGEKQKILIARALCQQTPVIILDEPTAFLDFKNKKDILELLSSIAKEMKKTVILSTHDIDAALAYCNKSWLMAEQKVFEEVSRTAAFKEEVSRKLLLT